jgi:16S rRNA (uracil1498-N3)-methyltransferase
MHRFYIPGLISSDNAIMADARQLHHLRNVLRLKAGDEVQVFDGAGREFSAIISELVRGRAVLTIKRRNPVPVKNIKLAVACAVPKRSIMDDIVDKLTQLGVDEIIPLATDRVVSKFQEKGTLRLDRWRKIAISAAQQSHRNSLPAIAPVTGLKAVISRSAGFDLKLIASTRGERKTIKEVIPAGRPSAVFILIGPEGDFTTREIEQASAAGFIPVSLGDSILRVDTAAVAITAYVRFALLD